MADKEQEWIEKFRAAMETVAPIKESRLKAILADLSRVRTLVCSIWKRSSERTKAVLSMSVSEPSPEPESTQTLVTALEQRHRPPSKSSKPISAERPASQMPQRRRAS